LGEGEVENEIKVAQRSLADLKREESTVVQSRDHLLTAERTAAVEARLTQVHGSLVEFEKQRAGLQEKISKGHQALSREWCEPCHEKRMAEAPWGRCKNCDAPRTELAKEEHGVLGKGASKLRHQIKELEATKKKLHEPGIAIREARLEAVNLRLETARQELSRVMRIAEKRRYCGSCWEFRARTGRLPSTKKKAGNYHTNDSWSLNADRRGKPRRKTDDYDWYR